MAEIEKVLLHERNEKAQEILRDAGYYNGVIDGIFGTRSKAALTAYKLKFGTMPDVLSEIYLEIGHEPVVKKGIEIPLSPARFVHYSGQEKTFWLHEDVRDSFVAAVADWQAQGFTIQITETLRTVDAQRRAKIAKPALCVAAGWSAHGHGRAVDINYVSVVKGCKNESERSARMQRWYITAARHGWLNINSQPDNIRFCKHNGTEQWNAPECWHVQNLNPPGTHVKAYMTAWAQDHGVKDYNSVQKTLESLIYVYKK